MATWYSDYVSGSVNNSGDSFSVDLTGTVVATGSSTVTCAAGGLTGKANRKMFIVGVGGFTISSVSSDTVCVLNTAVAGGSYTFNIGGRRTTMQSFASSDCDGITGGDTVRMKASEAPTSMSVSGNWADCSPTIVLMGTSTNVTGCDSAWTASANVTATLNTTTFQEGTGSASLAVASGFTTGKAAYFDLGSTIDYSASQILSFKMQQTAGTNIIAGDLTIRLCSDSAGATPVSSFAAPALPIGGSSQGAKNVWIPVAIDLGSAISATCRSISLNVNVDRGAQTFLFDDFKVWTAPNLNKNIDMCDSAWTASANVTVSNGGARKEGTQSQKIAVAAVFGTGRAAYRATGTLDLSSYKQVSFSLRQTAGTLLATSGMSLRLCSDTAGVTTVHTIAIPALTSSALNQWHQVTVDTGADMNSAIASIALYVDTDVAAQDVEIDGIVACKETGSTGLTLQSLIGRPSSYGAGGDDTETWYRIRSINGNTVTLEAGPNSTAATASRGYYGGAANPPGIDTTWKRETIKTAFVAAATTAVQTTGLNGSAGNLLTWSGGWDTTDMSTQTDMTWFDGGNGLGAAVSVTSARTFNALVRIGFVSYGYGLYVATSVVTDWTVASCHSNCNGTYGFQYGHHRMTMTDCFANNNSNTGFAQYSATHRQLVMDNCCANNNVSTGVAENGYGSIKTNCIACNNASSGHSQGISTSNSSLASPVFCRNLADGASLSGAVRITEPTVYGNGTYGLNLSSAMLAVCGGVVSANTVSSMNDYDNKGIPSRLFNCTLSDTTEVLATSVFQDFYVYSTRHDNTDGNHWVFADGGTCNSQASVRHTASGIAWQMNPTSTNRASTYPLKMPLPPMVVSSGTTTIKVWLRRTNTGLTMSLVCLGGRLPGVASDVAASMTAAADTWEEVSVDVSPTSAGVVELEVWSYGGTTYTGYVDDMTCAGVAIPLDVGWNGAPYHEVIASGGGGSAGGASVIGSSIIRPGSLA